ncbi:conserved hypothetical protein [Tenacibaculum maritimum]|uniref:T6SS immunity protein Tdi1 domain-containing protein n=1 Tax=Tenacibaculum maritimum TaxID=107401 RepID=UPI0012E5988A|nr:T6SS immunity protein Tdi1 domain-containing protein [Tenacibaculum maritimum]CAA0152777.1 conserved hypothetical protein [Tenacibaculum maritimum]CAA0250893.1 conserved hypothetical protein [Tenacibaculum maritimum]
MNTINQFINRNKDTYRKQNDVSKEIIGKYSKMFKGYFPKEILWIWENMGFGIYENGYLQLVNPEDYDFVFRYIDKLLEPSIVFGITALGDLLLWEGNDNWTIAPNEGNRAVLLNIRNFKENMIGHNVDVYLNILINDEDDLLETYHAKPYLQIQNKLPKLEYGQCYGYVPALPLGGKKTTKNLQITDAKSYIDTIGQAVGKIINLED